MAPLNWKTLCRLYTLEQIQAKVDTYQDMLEQASVKSYSKDSTQGQQRVESADISRIESILQAWMKALECKSGISGPTIASGNFSPGGRTNGLI